MSKQTSFSQPIYGLLSTEVEGFASLGDLALDSRMDIGANKIDLPRPPVEQSAIGDEALMQAITHGNAPALSTLYDRYAPIVKSIALRIVHDEAEADDLLQ